METEEVILALLVAWFILWCVVKAYSLGGEK